MGVSEGPHVDVVHDHLCDILESVIDLRRSYGCDAGARLQVRYGDPSLLSNRLCRSDALYFVH